MPRPRPRASTPVSKDELFLEGGLWGEDDNGFECRLTSEILKGDAL